MFKFLQTMVSDESLMLKFQQGDFDAFANLYSRYKDRLFAFLYRSNRDTQAIEEIAQETWTAIIDSAKNYQPTARFNTYLFSVAHRKLVDYWRRHKRDNLFVQVDAEGNACVDTLEDERSSIDSATSLAMDLDNAFGKLSQEQQQALLLREEGFSREEIAMITGSNEETIKSRIRYASKTLQQLLGAEYAEQ